METLPDIEDYRFVATWMQTEVQLRFGRWMCWDNENSKHVASGSKGQMQQLAKLLNKSEVFLYCTHNQETKDDEKIRDTTL